MGFSPQQVDAMSMWQFMAAWKGWRRANMSDPGPKPPTAEQHYAAMASAHTIH